MLIRFLISTALALCISSTASAGDAPTLSDVPAAIAVGIKNDCAEQFPRDYSTRSYCIKMQVEAYQALRRDGGLTTKEQSK